MDRPLEQMDGTKSGSLQVCKENLTVGLSLADLLANDNSHFSLDGIASLISKSLLHAFPSKKESRRGCFCLRPFASMGWNVQRKRWSSLHKRRFLNFSTRCSTLIHIP